METKYSQVGKIAIAETPYTFQKKRLLSHMMSTLKCLRNCQNKHSQKSVIHECQHNCKSILY